MVSERVALLALAGFAAAAWATPPPLPPVPDAVRRQAEPTAERPAFSRYQVILDRQPFGDPTPPAPPAPPRKPEPPPNPAESFVRNLRMVAITEGPDGTLRVGLVSVARPARPVRVRPGQPRPPAPPPVAQQSYYLRVGETSADGITLVDANYDEEKALLRKDDEEHWISMGGGVTEAPGQTAAADVPRPTVTVAGPRSDGSRTVTVTGSRRRDAAAPTAVRAHPQTMSYEERRKWREEVIRRRQQRAVLPRDQDATGAPITPEERQRRLQELNMELIRARGEKGPPLPIQLTAEQDAQLVEEGVLPSLDDEEEE